ncbi:hypothetical protein [Riemerella columbina]|uniref:hypothetical protein n=1 Tax=Riemerella columbina TaxID=103810 RepID=UPI0003604DCE|nr:hypothetical protein [Riemerella columbina]
MKQWIALLLILCLCACRGNEDTIQEIDQTLQIFVKNSAGEDLLHPKTSNYFFSYTIDDLGGQYSKVPIRSGYTTMVNKDSIYYIQYIAGATRNLKDSISPDLKYYTSDISITWNKKVNDSVTQSTTDTLNILYQWKPERFAIQEVFVNKTKVFEKQQGKDNTVTIVK